MKRPILIATIGYIIGIIVGLYLKISIVLFYIPIAVIYFLIKKNKNENKKLKLFSIKRYLRYIKIYINSNVLLIIIISSIISNLITILESKKYEVMYKELSSTENIALVATVISNKEEKEYYNKYKVKTKYKNKDLRFYITVDKNKDIKYGDKIKLSGNYIQPESQRNYKGFDYSEYLKQLKIYGTIKCKNIKILKENDLNTIILLSNKIENDIESKAKRTLDKETSSIFLGIMLGKTQEIDETNKENFRNASMAHILAISGMHITYIIIGVNLTINKLLGKRKTQILTIIILIFYLFLTNFSPSVTRAVIMGVLMITAKLIYKRNDTITSLSLSLLLSLVYNPYLIKNLGIQLSYGGVLGILLFNNTILKILNKVKFKKIISVSISVQIFILPISILQFNNLTPYFLITNLILSFVIGPIVICGFAYIIMVLISAKIATIFSPIITLSVGILTFISKIGNLPLSKIYVATPKINSIILYYLILSIVFSIYKIYSPRKPNNTQIRIKNIIAIIRIKVRKNKKKLIRIITVSFIIIFIFNIVPKELRIYFVDVGQGDSTFIVTPKNKTILIDGGGSSNFDVGKNTLLPYILDRGYTKIDTIIISHFDNDHIRTDY